MRNELDSRLKRLKLDSGRNKRTDSASNRCELVRLRLRKLVGSRRNKVGERLRLRKLDSELKLRLVRSRLALLRRKLLRKLLVLLALSGTGKLRYIKIPAHR
jgi:hypothetical protein